MIGNGGNSSEISARDVFRDELTRQRERAGWTLAEVAERSRYDGSYLQRLEKGDRIGSIDAIGVLDRIYGTGDLLKGLWRLAKREVKSNRYQGFMDLEAEAGSMQQFSVSAVPGLLQTEAYATAQLGTDDPESDDLLAEHVEARMRRQGRLFDAAKPLRYRALLDESVIRRPTLDPAVWTEQLERLIFSAGLPHISLHVVPFSAGLHNLLGGSLTLLWLPSGRNVAYVESSLNGQLIEETEEVESLRLSYDRLRDSALSPGETRALLQTALEDHKSCSSHRGRDD
ncbi:helix-turn-helix transcriptional regulator [Actinacidiphila alni]|uniref:helix-turn-helix domain-containing protein n=1 Tax=Actinacidiphila alni TaxID=380248 RepID=UPI0033DF775B